MFNSYPVASLRQRKSIHCGLIETAETDPEVSRPRNPNDYLEYLGECEATSETVLSRESGPYGGLLDEEKKPRVENLVILFL
jgi:hypothetical protein